MVSPLPKINLCRWDRFFLMLAGGYGAVAVGLSAYRAHGLTKKLQAAGVPAEEISERLATLATAVDLTLLHVAALVAVIALSAGRMRYVTCLAFAGGSFLFGGSLSCQSIWSLTWPAFVPPTGGMLLIGGWLWLIGVGWFGPGAKQPSTC